MGRKRKVGKPRGRNGGRKPIESTEVRKSRSIYCSDFEYSIIKMLLAFHRGILILDKIPPVKKVFLETYTGESFPIESDPSGLIPTEFERLTVFDLEYAFGRSTDRSDIPEITIGLENLFKTGNLHGHPMPENPSEIDRIL